MSDIRKKIDQIFTDGIKFAPDGEAYPDRGEIVNDLEALINQEQLELLDRLEKKIPKEEHPIVDYDPEFTSGANHVADEVNRAIHQEKEKLK